MSSPARTAVVVGGTSGIGAAVVEAQRAGGAEVVTWDVHESADVGCDIADPAQIDAAVAATTDLIGAPGLATITAGVGHSGFLSDAGPDEWDHVMNINARGVWLCMRALAATGATSIVVVSSVSARLADRSMGVYCASKAALDMVVRVAAREWAPNVRVNAVAPGVTDTRMLGPVPRDGPWLSGVVDRTPLGRLGTPDDVAASILAVHGLPWLTGQIIDCDGGLALFSPIGPDVGPRPA